MKELGLPVKQGLYDPQFEHDACGIGFMANIKGIKSHDVVDQAIKILINMTHRGGCGAEEQTGDGAGILIQVPHKFLTKVCHVEKIDLPNEGEYAVGMVFLSPNEKIRQQSEKLLKEIIEDEGQVFLGWRTLPTNPSSLGDSAKASMPLIKQMFIKKSAEIQDEKSFERKLYVIRKRAEKLIRNGKAPVDKCFYIASLSPKTIVYKGMLTPEQVKDFYLDLNDADMESAIALVHSRFSTNTFPSWERAHPNRYIIHNGEINTIRGNVNWMHAREANLKSDLFGEDLNKVFPIVNQDGSDSAMLDNCVEFLTLGGRSLPHSMMMTVPEPWSKHESMSDTKRAFYEYHSCLMEPWDGPAAIGFTDGTVVGAILDRNGLRPARYYITKDDMVVLASEVGVLEIAPERIKEKGRLKPGRMFLVDTKEGRIILDEEIKEKVASQHPYREWLDQNLLSLDDLGKQESVKYGVENLLQYQKSFGYTFEDLRIILGPMAENGEEAIGSMGTDTPLAVLSDRPQSLFNYFRQLFAQVTNPPIDALREEIITSTETVLGSEANLLDTKPENCFQIKLKTPIIVEEELEKIRNINKEGFKALTLPIKYKVNEGSLGLEKALDNLFEKVSDAIKEGYNIFVLSDRGIDKEYAAIPSLLAVSGLHHHLIREGSRASVALVLESGEPREVHHFSLLIGYGVSAVCPYLAIETIRDCVDKNIVTGVSTEKAVYNYVKAATKGVVKVLSKMGISTFQSYQGSQIFEALGLKKELVDKYFTWTPTRIEGIGIEELSLETRKKHENAFVDNSVSDVLEAGGNYQWRKDGEYHQYNPETIYKLQYATRTGNYELYKEYSELLNDQTQRLCTLRGLLEIKKDREPIPLDEVESVESICKRFKTGAMSYGSISQEAHETLAIAMNRIGGKSNTGEGGEDPDRFLLDENGDSRSSAIKQVASGRFGVTSEYLVNAKEIQIKMAQGAKPGEGGQLPGLKVYPWIAKARYSTPGVGLISPPPHHDIYSIEDLAQLIFDLKNANCDANISVKLVSEVGVGTVAAGVAKGRADVILISGCDGGTGASPRTSIQYAGLPWELGLAEAHQTLMLNGLRNRVRLETDGKLMTGRDVVVAALLGAEEFGFATAPLVVLGCVMMRVCHKDTCATGIATQNPELRKRFCGKPEYVENFMKFIAQDVREWMAGLGFRTIDEMVGRVDRLETKSAIDHWKAKGVDFSSILYNPPATTERHCTTKQNHEIEKTLDYRLLLGLSKPALEYRMPVEEEVKIQNTDRATGTILGSEITKRYGSKGLPENTITFNFKGSAGQSFGAFVPSGMTMILEGDANDYIGKGLSGGKIIVCPPKSATFAAEDNVIIGNVAFYGATSGEAYIRGAAGERFCVRNSGVKAVVESVGDHGCEYMTGGRVVVLGSTGRNFAAGMSGGIAYIFDEKGNFESRCNKDMVDLEKIVDDKEFYEVKKMIMRHMSYTGSEKATYIIKNWETLRHKFVRVIPRDYKRMLELFEQSSISGISKGEALMIAFDKNNKKLARVSGN
ncbi:glutamate synthase large subunit [Serpentinicella alkaliphila]|uniref:Glutamate synthase (Ferredoxin) n=1 Tax=Serpentinicella alkaliphila TaxID=1734049 RepID=A0A4R2TTE5_9FIRM|nr:glutamate synthase large subunit [Serpentinicella alkaliphila]QUH24577.1 glutamate synthase large subunit [Serpentinicella alkaliphila]TCQ04675.1 glutamate synthase (ferredoxin) [Serpentinicella alkaliphila]